MFKHLCNYLLCRWLELCLVSWRFKKAGEKQYLIVVSFCISLINNKHTFIHLLAIYYYFWEIAVFWVVFHSSFCNILTDLQALKIFCIVILYLWCIYISFSILGLSFHFLYGVKVLNAFLSHLSFLNCYTFLVPCFKKSFFTFTP